MYTHYIIQTKFFTHYIYILATFTSERSICTVSNRNLVLWTFILELGISSLSNKLSEPFVSSLLFYLNRIQTNNQEFGYQQRPWNM